MPSQWWVAPSSTYLGIDARVVERKQPQPLFMNVCIGAFFNDTTSTVLIRLQIGAVGVVKVGYIAFPPFIGPLCEQLPWSAMHLDHRDGTGDLLLAWLIDW
jgi:hypothetical protein